MDIFMSYVERHKRIKKNFVVNVSELNDYITLNVSKSGILLAVDNDIYSVNDLLNIEIDSRKIYLGKSIKCTASVERVVTSDSQEFGEYTHLLDGFFEYSALYGLHIQDIQDGDRRLWNTYIDYFLENVFAA